MCARNVIVTTPMTEAQIHEYQQRWRQINAFERAEVRRTPISVKLRQLVALMASARELGWDTRRPSEDAVVRQRWRRLRKAQLG
jgi:hypothetical protein